MYATARECIRDKDGRGYKYAGCESLSDGKYDDTVCHDAKHAQTCLGIRKFAIVLRKFERMALKSQMFMLHLTNSTPLHICMLGFGRCYIFMLRFECCMFMLYFARSCSGPHSSVASVFLCCMLVCLHTWRSHSKL